MTPERDRQTRNLLKLRVGRAALFSLATARVEPGINEAAVHRDGRPPGHDIRKKYQAHSPTEEFALQLGIGYGTQEKPIREPSHGCLC